MEREAFHELPARYPAVHPATERGISPLSSPPAASIIIPVNAQGDVNELRMTLADIQRYAGKHTYEIILVINNYPPEDPPAVIETFQAEGLRVVAVPDASHPGVVVILNARVLGTQAARSEVTIHFDADCRIPDINSLLDWYVKRLTSGAKVAYTHVGFYDSPKKTAVYVKHFLHHTSRWVKRNILGIPTTRGSNYAVARSMFLGLYHENKLSVDMQVGPAVKLAGGGVAYSGRRNLRVLTSARRDSGRWSRLIPYFTSRLFYNLKAVPTRSRLKKGNTWAGFDKENENRQNLELPTRPHK